jgi:allantoin racemase
MKIWYQLVSAEKSRSHFLSDVQGLCDRAAQPGTTIEVRGTASGALGDQVRFFYNADVQEIIANGLQVRAAGTYDAFVLANSLDGGITELREVLDIPVISFMETACAVACMMGERVGLLIPYARMMPRFRELGRTYLRDERLAAIEPVMSEAFPGFRDAFTNTAAGDAALAQIFAAARKTIDQGADVIIPAGPAAALLPRRGIYQIDNVPVIDCYSLLVKAAEMMVAMHRLTGIHISRRLAYQMPSAEMLDHIARTRGVDLLKPPASAVQRGVGDT